MTVTAWTPSDTPTGLSLDDLRAFSEDEAAAIAGWHVTVSGDDEGRRWWPWAVRAMPPETRLHLASDPLMDEVWKAQERAYVIADPFYFINGYGHVQPPDGEPIPFRMWDEQEDVLGELVVAAILVILKARQLGLTWIALHYACWLLAFCQTTPRARVLLLSKGLDEAKILLKRMRRIYQLLPDHLRPRESQRTGDPGASVTELDLIGRGSVRSLPSSPKSARMETVTFALVDEAAFHADFQSTWQSLLSTLGVTGQAAVVSTGNGPEEAPGEGQAYARLWRRASTGDVEEVAGGVRSMRAVFLPDSVDPTRSPEVREAMRRNYLTDEDYFAEHPEDEEQALMGRTEGKAYSPAAINAAERLGRLLDAEFEAGTIAPPLGGMLLNAGDYGEHTHHLIGWPLEGGGMYIMREVVGGGVHGQSVRQVALNVCRAIDDCQWIERARGATNARRWPLCRGGLYDAAAPSSNRTFREVVHSNVILYPAKDYPLRTPLQAKTRTLDMWQTVNVGGASRIRTRGMPFGGQALGGRGRSLKQSMIDYFRALLRNTLDAEEGEGDGGGVVAISPNCPVFLRQLRGLETNDYGDIKKGDDHGPDAGLVLLYPSAAAYHGVVLDESDEVQEAA